MRISDWSSDVCSSDLRGLCRGGALLRLERIFVLIFAGDVVTLGDDLGGADNRHIGVLVHREQLGVGLDEQLAAAADQIGRASCRERVCKYVSIQVGAVSLKKETEKDTVAYIE